MDTAVVVALVYARIVTGLLSGLWMARHGHDPLWTLIAVVLGPLFVPIALKRVQRHPDVATQPRTHQISGERVPAFSQLEPM
jgi:hypothetical protein